MKLNLQLNRCLILMIQKFDQHLSKRQHGNLFMCKDTTCKHKICLFRKNSKVKKYADAHKCPLENSFFPIEFISIIRTLFPHMSLLSFNVVRIPLQLFHFQYKITKEYLLKSSLLSFFPYIFVKFHVNIST